MKKIIITIDGHSACGKSTLAKALALELDYGYIDTGAMYRAVTFFFLENRVNIQKTAELERALKKIKITFKSTVAGNRTYLNGKDVEDVIRKMFVSKNVSHVAAISPVRKMVVKQQKEMGKQKGIVMEGRDIGTVVFPKAELKVFLTADEDIRTQRRFDELKKKGQQVSLKAVKNNLLERDHIDSTRKDSPLKKAKEAVLIDNSNITQREQLTMVLALAKERIRRLSVVEKKTTPVKKTPAPTKPKASTPTRKTPAKTKQRQPQSKTSASSNRPTSSNQKTQPTTQKSTNQQPTKTANTNQKIKSNTQKNTPNKSNTPTRTTQKNTNQQPTKTANSNRNTKSNTQNPAPKKSTTPTTKDKPTKTNPPKKTNSNRKTTPQKDLSTTTHTKKANKPHPKPTQQKTTKTVSRKKVYKKPSTDKKSS